jgi:hypothetical protein
MDSDPAVVAAPGSGRAYLAQERDPRLGIGCRRVTQRCIAPRVGLCDLSRLGGWGWSTFLELDNGGTRCMKGRNDTYYQQAIVILWSERTHPDEGPQFDIWERLSPQGDGCYGSE